MGSVDFTTRDFMLICSAIAGCSFITYMRVIDPRLYETCDTCDTTVYCCSFCATRPSSAVESFRRRLVRKPPLSKSFLISSLSARKVLDSFPQRRSRLYQCGAQMRDRSTKILPRRCQQHF